MAHLASSGRGGAGNFVDSSKSPRLVPEDLETPTLKTSMVTTGRGGTGNMAKNTDPAETRLRQDVEPVARRPSSGAQHVGRGGTGNVFKPGSAEAEAAKKAQQKSDNAIADDAAQKNDYNVGLAEKGKQWLLGKK